MRVRDGDGRAPPSPRPPRSSASSSSGMQSHRTLPSRRRGPAAPAGRWRTAGRCRCRSARALLADRLRWSAAQLVERRPLLAVPADVLPLVLADAGSARGRRWRRRAGPRTSCRWGGRRSWVQSARKTREAVAMDDFDALVREYLDAYFTEAPEQATMHGYDGFDDRLPELSAAAIERRAADDERWDERFASFADDRLDTDDRIDRDLVRSTLAGRRILRDWQDWRRLPDTYVQPGLTGAVRPVPPPAPSRGRAGRPAPSPGWRPPRRCSTPAGPTSTPSWPARRSSPGAINQCRAGGDLRPRPRSPARSKTTPVGPGSPTPARGRRGLRVVRRLPRRARGSGPAGRGSSASRAYTALLRDKELLGSTRRRYGSGAGGLRRAGGGDADAGPRRVGHRRLPRGPPRPGRRPAGYPGGDARRLRGGDRVAPAVSSSSTSWSRCPRANVRRGAVAAVPTAGAGGGVVPAPARVPAIAGRPVQRAIPARRHVARGGRPAAGHNCYAEMPTISVHEAYPGHHWHIARMQAARRRTAPAVLLSTSYFSEGWALYAELMMREQGFFSDPPHELAHLDARLFRAARIVVDTSLHCGDMTFDEAVAFMHDQGRADRAGGPGRGHPLLRLADSGVGLPHRLASRSSGCATGGSPRSGATCGRSTTRSAARARCRSPSPSGRCSATGDRSAHAAERSRRTGSERRERREERPQRFLGVDQPDPVGVGVEPGADRPGPRRRRRPARLRQLRRRGAVGRRRRASATPSPTP